jgi:hypothetical protein
MRRSSKKRRTQEPETTELSPATGSPSEHVQRIKEMPKEVGVLLVVAGVGGLLLPGPIGTPFLVVGGVVLWPRAFEKVEAALARKFPKMHGEGVRLIVRFLSDLERRYPSSKEDSSWETG